MPISSWGARDDESGSIGRLLAVPVPVLDELLQRVFEILAEMEPVPLAVGSDGLGDAFYGLFPVIDEAVAEF